MKIYNKEINVNEMTRSGEKRKKVTKVIICPICHEDPIEYIESLNNQDEKYLSYNYIIEESGRILNIIPEDEISYPTCNISINLESISIGIQLKDKKDNINPKEEESLITLLRTITKKYELDKNRDMVICYDLFSTREFEYYIDNYCELEEIIKNI